MATQKPQERQLCFNEASGSQRDELVNRHSSGEGVSGASGIRHQTSATTASGTYDRMVGLPEPVLQEVRI